MIEIARTGKKSKQHPFQIISNSINGQIQDGKAFLPSD